MDRQEAIKILHDCKAYGFRYTQYNLVEYHEAIEMAISDMRKMSYLTDRPCSACKFNPDGNGCKKWTCAFEDYGKENE